MDIKAGGILACSGSGIKKQDRNHGFQKKTLPPLQRSAWKDPKAYGPGHKKAARAMILQPLERFVPTSRKSSKGIRRPAWLERMSCFNSDIKRSVQRLEAGAGTPEGV